ncbi:MAG: hypothetical protein IPL41_17055 [Micropruina sp.]|nr:hypothetical protein [Micropruina sp.]
MRTPALVVAVAAVGLLVGCVQPAQPTPTPTPTVSEVTVDLTAPGQARSMVRRLIAKAGTPQLIQVEITQQWAAITVVKNEQPETWAWRDNTVKQVDSDVAYVQQRVFSIDDFNISDVGALFRAASGISGSESSQELQIVDSSAGDLFMSVSTNPESRTVFFYPSGALLPTLDFNTEGGIRAGLDDVIGSRSTALAIGVQSTLGAWLDLTGSDTTTIRRLRTATVPVTINERSGRPDLPPFSVSRLRAEAIWQVLSQARQRGDFDASTRWQVTVDDRARLGGPRMYFTIGNDSFVTDLTGHEINP